MSIYIHVLFLTCSPRVSPIDGGRSLTPQSKNSLRGNMHTLGSKSGEEAVPIAAVPGGGQETSIKVFIFMCE